MFRVQHFTVLLSLAGAGFFSQLALSQKTNEIPAGTIITVRVIESLNSGKTQTGEIFHGTLEQPISVEGKDVYPKGADVSGRVVDARPSGRLSEPGELDLVLATIASGHQAWSVRTEPLVIKGESHTKSNAGKIGGGAALGAVIGAIAGGGKGAAIGAGVGAAAGTGAAAATGKREAVVESEAVLRFVTTQNSAIEESISPAPERPSSVAEKPAPTDEAPRQTSETPDREGEPPNRQAESANRQGEAASTSHSDSGDYSFTGRDRRVIRNCIAEHVADLPVGATEREDLPAGIERQVRAGGTLPAELEKKAQPLPLACEQQLPQLHNDVERVIYNGRVLLIDDESGHILDMFYLEGTQ